MDELDGALALVSMMANPETTMKNAAAMKEIRAEKQANTKLLKEIKYATLESEKQLRQVESQRVALRESKMKFSEKESALVDREAASVRSVREAEKVAKSLRTPLEEREEAVKLREQKIARKERTDRDRKVALDAREKDVSARGNALASAVQRATAVGEVSSAEGVG